MAEHDFASPAFGDLLERLGSDSPTPGGGSGAALAGAMGASLVRMLALLTVGKKRYEQHEELMKAIADQAGEASQRLLDLAAKDAAAYDAVSAAFKMARETDEEKAARKEAIQKALRGATQVPLEIMEQCLEVIGIAKNAVQSGNRNALSDGAAGAELARAALKVASYNVKINLASLEDEAFRKDARTRVDEMLYMGQNVAVTIDSFVQDVFDGGR